MTAQRHWHAVEPDVIPPGTWADTMPHGTSEWTAPDCDDIAIPPPPAPVPVDTLDWHEIALGVLFGALVVGAFFAAVWIGTPK